MLSGTKVDGAYFYDQFKQDIKLEGAVDSKGELSITEGAWQKENRVSLFAWLNQKRPDTDLECEWVKT
jgi:hypothetical protein